MITVKAFDRNLRCLGFQYKVGKEYEIEVGFVEMCYFGFHASANCDISETVDYYPDVVNNRYCLVDIHVVDKEEDKVVGDKIKILKELSFEECIEYDKTGKWCYEYAKITGDEDKTKILENAVIEKDETGFWCLHFAMYVENADIRRLEDVVVEKDETGKGCYFFALHVVDADIKRLKDAVIKKDRTGEWCYKFAEFVDDAYGWEILQKMREKFGESNKWYKYLKKSLKKYPLKEV